MAAAAASQMQGPAPLELPLPPAEAPSQPAPQAAAASLELWPSLVGPGPPAPTVGPPVGAQSCPNVSGIIAGSGKAEPESVLNGVGLPAGTTAEANADYDEVIRRWQSGAVYSPASSGVPTTSQHDGPERELISIRMVVDKPPDILGQAVSQSLLDLRPGVYHESKEKLEMPWPVSPEWADYASMPPQFQAERVFKGGQEWEKESWSLGLRPLCADELITQVVTQEGLGYEVQLRSGATSRISAVQRKGVPYTFDLKVWSNKLDQATEDFQQHLPEPPYIASTVKVRKATDGKYSELIRTLLFEGPLVELAKHGHQPAVAYGVLNFMLEMEARAWLSYRNFPLIEVWRGLRRAHPVYLMPMLNVIQSYALGTGHAGASAKEQADGPIYNASLAQKLSAILPNCPQGANGANGPKGREYTEGNVNVESFAAVLGRICRRAAPSADIYRKFVDLGSGRGHAVLAAHALFPFRACIGCELVPEVVKASKEAARTYVDSGLSFYALSKVDPEHLFLQGDFFQDLNWSDASIVFANALTFPKHLIQELGQQALRLRPGAVLLITVKTLPTDDPMILEAFDVRGDAVLMGFMQHACRLWAYQRR